QSGIALAGEQRSPCPCIAFEEHAFDGVRAYYPYVRKGAWVYEYTIRLNQSGRFELPATRVEALYAPEAFGELPNAPFGVKPCRAGSRPPLPSPSPWPRSRSGSVSTSAYRRLRASSACARRGSHRRCISSTATDR